MQTPPRQRRAFGPGLSLSLGFSGLFGFVGVHMPYFPAWLSARGLEPWAVGLLLGALPWMRIALNPQVGAYADRTGRARGVLIGLAWSVVVMMALYTVPLSPLGVAVVTLVGSAVFAPIPALMDGLAVGHSRSGEIDYGRTRLFGSAAFVASNLLLGPLCAEGGHAVPWSLLGLSVALGLATFSIPPGARPDVAAPRVSAVSVARRGPVWRYLLTAGLINGSHATVYAFGTVTFLAKGASEGQIGWLWSIGVFAEIALFAAGRRVRDRFAPETWLIIGGLGAMVRWPLIYFAPGPLALFAAQSLHGLTFGATHLGGMAFLERRVPEIGTGLGLHTAATGGLAMGLGMPLAGALFQRFGEGAFLVAALMALAGLASALGMRAHIRGLGSPA